MSAQNRKQIKKNYNVNQQLKRLVLANMLFEDQFYVDGESTVDIIKRTVKRCDGVFVHNLALEARNRYKLRHIPLLLLRELAASGRMRAEVLRDVIQRPDEIGEFLALYWKDGKQPLSNQVKKGLAMAFNKFNEYEFAKWDKNSAKIKLRDAMFLCHPKPDSADRVALFRRIAENNLEVPDTWETQLSGGADKKETFIRLMIERKLGALAFLRNLRNMQQSGVHINLIKEYAQALNFDKVLPFRFIAAARQVPDLKEMLEPLMLQSLTSHKKLMGKTVLLVDVSASMFGTKISTKSDLDRFDAAASLAILAREICEDVDIYTFSNKLVWVQDTRGFNMVDTLKESQSHMGTQLIGALEELHCYGSEYDRCIVFTDEQSTDYRGKSVPDPEGIGYIVNVAAYEKGLTTDAWTTINGMSEAVIDYIIEDELFNSIQS